MATPACDHLRRVARQALRPSERVPLDAWADRHRVIAHGTSPSPGPWSTDLTPYLREPMRACSDPAVRSVTYMKGSQLGVTEMLINHLLRLADCDPGPALVLYPNADLASYNNTERFTPAVRACPRLVDRLRGAAKGGAASRDLKAMQVQFDRMSVYFVGSNSMANLESRPIRDLLVDELDADEFDGRAYDRATERQKAFSRRKTIVVSKPSLELCGVHRVYLAGDRRHYFVPCPHCGRYQTLSFNRLRWDRDAKLSSQDIEAQTFYCCAACEGRVESHHKAAMLAGGVWIPEAQAARGETLEASQRPANDTPLPHHVSYQMGSLYSPFLRFGYVSKVYVERGGAERGWVNGELGEPWADLGDKVERREAEILCVPHARGGYRLCTDATRPTPDPVRALFAGVDLQRDRAYAAVWGLSDYARHAYLVWFGQLPLLDPQRPGVDYTFARLEQLLNMSVMHPDGMPMGLSAMAVDSGDGERTKLIYDWVTRQPQHVYAAKGRWGGLMDLPWERKQLPFERDATLAQELQPARSLVRFLTFNADFWKGCVLGQFRRCIERAKTPAAKGQDPDQAACYLPEMEPAIRLDVFLDQLTSEYLVPVRVRSGRDEGRLRQQWKLRPGFTANHYLDATTIAWALADSLSAPTLLTPDNWTADRARRRQALAHQQAAQEHAQPGHRIDHSRPAHPRSQAYESRGPVNAFMD